MGVQQLVNVAFLALGRVPTAGICVARLVQRPGRSVFFIYRGISRTSKDASCFLASTHDGVATANVCPQTGCNEQHHEIPRTLSHHPVQTVRA